MSIILMGVGNMRNLDYYLTSGDKTRAGENVKKMASLITGKNSEDIIKQIMYTIQKIEMIPDKHTKKKFKRTAEEIIEDRYRDGCCDCSTLFVALAREKGIPAMQIITACVLALEKEKYSVGHFFSGCYLKESNKWVWIDTAKSVKSIDDVELKDFNPNSKYIKSDYYIFGLERDYSDFELDGTKIDSIHNMNKIHKMVYDKYFNCIER